MVGSASVAARRARAAILSESRRTFSAASVKPAVMLTGASPRLGCLWAGCGLGIAIVIGMVAVVASGAIAVKLETLLFVTPQSLAGWPADRWSRWAVYVGEETCRAPAPASETVSI